MVRYVAFLLCLGSILCAQEFRATLTGRVSDPSGAAIPGAKISVSNRDTGAQSDTVSSAQGTYTVPFLPPGIYQITAEASGFKRYVQERVQLGTNERVSQDIQLELGSSSEEVTVTAEAPLLTTATASTGQVIDSRQVESMPLNGRTPMMLAQLANGVISTSAPGFARPFDNGASADISMGGGPARSNELLLNGVPNMTSNRRAAYNPPVDAVTEVKTDSFQADAAYGDTGGGTVNVTTKGGTNTFHGTLYEFNQTSALAATPFFTNRAGQKKPVTRYNQYGGSIGGPVWIPKIVDGHNRLFFFFTYEGIKNSSPEPISTTVPTEKQRRGDFSDLLALGSAYQLYDPATGVLQNGRVVRQRFENNVIPQNRLNPVALNYLNYFPLPNQQGGPDGSNNYLANTVRSDTFGSYLGRLDFNASDKHKMFFDFRNNDRLENRGNRFNNIATGNFLARTNWGATFDDVYAFTPTLLLNTRLGWTRFVEGNTRSSNGFDPTVLGFPSYIAGNATRLVMPRIKFRNDEYNQLGDSAGSVTPFDTFQIFSTLTKVFNTHNLKVGTDLRLLRESATDFSYATGSYGFDSTWVLANSGAAAQPMGGALASFLLGLPISNSDSRYLVSSARTNQSNYAAFFIQDDWRVRPNLTINLGLRYEFETPTRERWNRTLRGFDAEAVNSATQAARAAYAANPSPLLPPGAFNPTGGALFADEQHRDIYSTPRNSFSPRFGISWTPAALHNKTVLRTGAGIFYFTYGTRGVSQPGFSQTTPLADSLDSYLTPFATLSDPFPRGIQPPAGSTLGVDTNLGQNIDFQNTKLQQPYAVRWSFDIQHELAPNLLLQVGYLGNHSVHLTNRYGLNAIPLEYLSPLPYRDQATINRLNQVIANPFNGLLPGSLGGSQIAVGNLLRPFPQFSGDNGVRMADFTSGSSYFHQFFVSVQKRFSGGLQFMANYSHSRLMERNSRLNLADPTNQKRVSSDDRPDRFVLSASYDLPFGQGKKFGTGAGRWMDLLIGGWTVNTIYTYQTGEAVEWGNVIYYGGDLNWNPRNIDQTFDTSRFNRKGSEQLQYNIRTFPSHFSNLRQDAINNIDLSVIKNFKITERVGLQYRAESFNAFNRAQFEDPNVNPTSGTFGRITGQDNLPRVIQMALRLRF